MNGPRKEKKKEIKRKKKEGAAKKRGKDQKSRPEHHVYLRVPTLFAQNVRKEKEKKKWKLLLGPNQ